MAKSVGITGIFRRDQLVGGVHSFFQNLTRGLAESLGPRGPESEVNVTVFHSPVETIARDERLIWQEVPARFGRFVAESRIGLLDGRHFDALMFHNYHVPLIVRARRAFTVIHDLQWRHLPEYHSPAKRLWLNRAHGAALRKCHRVVAISHAVKDDILRQFGGCWASRIEVIWNPVNLDRFHNGDDRGISDGRPYILCVGVDRPQKNLSRLIQAFALVRKKLPEMRLVLAGQLRSLRRDWREKSGQAAKMLPSAADLVEELKLGEHVHVTGFISDQELGAIYRGATMCVLPSLFEGFGMPAVESMALGKPTLVSGLPVLREITFGSAQYLDDPRNVVAMADAMAEILAAPGDYCPSPQLVDKLKTAFSPRRIADQYLRILTE